MWLPPPSPHQSIITTLPVTSDHCSGEDDPGGGGDGLTTVARPQVRETIFSSEIRSVEYAERPEEAETREVGDKGTILFDDIGNAHPRMLPQSDAFF